MSVIDPIADSNDPRITNEDRDLFDSLVDTWECNRDLGWFIDIRRKRGIQKIAENRIEQVCRSAGLPTEYYPRLSSLIWYHTDGQQHGWTAETWKDHAEDLQKERDKLREEREEALEALGFHPDDLTVNIAAEIRSLRDEGRSHFHDVTNLLTKIRETERVRALDESEIDALNLEIARLAEEEKARENE